MFNRNFMKTFPIFKYCDPTAATGSYVSDIYLVSKRETIPRRILTYLLTSIVLISAFHSFEIYYQIVSHINPPYIRNWVKYSVPKQVIEHNQPIIQGFKIINKMKNIEKVCQL